MHHSVRGHIRRRVVRVRVSNACKPVFPADLVIQPVALHHVASPSQGVFHPHLSVLVVHRQRIELSVFRVSQHRFVPVLVDWRLLRHSLYTVDIFIFLIE